MSFKRQLYLFHRWAGIVLCLFFALWFFSGFFMMYVEFPQLTAPERRAGAEKLDFSSARLTPRQAVARLTARDFAISGTPPRNVSLSAAGPISIVAIQLGMLQHRPVYRIKAAGKAQPRVVFADDGSILRTVTPELARRELTDFLERTGRPSTLTYEGSVQTDQWTVSGAMNPHRPLYKFSVEDTVGTEMYVSSSTAEIVRDSSRRERILNYFGAVTHWLYPTFIRKFPDVWEWIVDIVSGVGTVLAITGVWIGILRWKRRPGRGVSPYNGLLKWHHYTGLAFGALTVTWVFSGLLSMNPGDFDPPRAPSSDEMLVLAGKRLSPDDFPVPNTAGFGAHAVEAELFHYDSRPYIKVTSRAGATHVLYAGPESAEHSIDTAELSSKLSPLLPNAPLASVQTLTRYDNYYYSRHPELGERVLPVIRARFDDKAHTWFHIDPQTGQVLERSTRTNRVYRWLYNGLHSFDILWLWEHRPLWDIVVITFSLGGFALSMLGVVVGIKRLEWKFGTAGRLS
jgi:hypothetical protein